MKKTGNKEDGKEGDKGMDVYICITNEATSH
jgi:hypothetical protein